MLELQECFYLDIDHKDEKNILEHADWFKHGILFHYLPDYFGEG